MGYYFKRVIFFRINSNIFFFFRKDEENPLLTEARLFKLLKSKNMRKAKIKLVVRWRRDLSKIIF